MSERRGLEESVEQHLSALVGPAVARTLVKQARRRGGPLHGGDSGSARAFVRGPLVEVLSPLVGRGEAARLAQKVERSLALERDWPVPDDDLLTGRISSPGDWNER